MKRLSANVRNGCPHRPPCPGCPRFGQRGPAPESLKRATALAESFGVEAQMVSGEAQGFRRRARLALRGRLGKPKLGIFEEGTHRVVDMPSCIVHHPVINQVAAALKRAAGALNVSSYSERSGLGLLRGLQVAVEREHNTAQVVVVTNDVSAASSHELLGRLSVELGGSLHSLFWNGNSDVGNRFLGSTFERFVGPEFLTESFGGARAYFGPGAFGQNNTELFARLVERVHTWIPEGSRVVEYYSGVGTIGLGLLSKAASVAFNEVGSASLVGLAAGLEDLPPAARARATVFPGSAGSCVSLLDEADVVVVDPPRKGLDVELLRGLESQPPPRLIYVSCGLDAFEREVVLLRKRLRLVELVVYDLFPFTEHVETLAVFERVSSTA